MAMYLVRPGIVSCPARLQQELLAEDGTLQAVKWVAHVMAHCGLAGGFWWQSTFFWGVKNDGKSPVPNGYT